MWRGSKKRRKKGRSQLCEGFRGRKPRPGPSPERLAPPKCCDSDLSLFPSSNNISQIQILRQPQIFVCLDFCRSLKLSKAVRKSPEANNKGRKIDKSMGRLYRELLVCPLMLSVHTEDSVFSQHEQELRHRQIVFGLSSPHDRSDVHADLS